MTMAEGVTHYPNPVHTVPPSVRSDGPRVQNGWDLDKINLEGNQGGVVRVPPSHVLTQIPSSYLSWLTPIPADAPIEDIRDAYQRDGVVQVRGLLDPEDVLSTREKCAPFPVRLTQVLRVRRALGRP